MGENERSGDGPSFDEVCLYLGMLLGYLTRDEGRAKLVVSLSSGGIRAVYVRKLRDQLTEALRASGKEAIE
jgi:hypothetical protein